MARGRKPQPAEVKEAKGNPGKRAIARVADGVAEASGKAPTWLTDKRALKVWQALHAELVRMKLLKSTDIGVFARYCQYWAEWLTLTVAIKRDGMTYKVVSAHGSYIRVNPKIAIRDKVENNLQWAERELGLTPSARQQILQRLAIQVPTAPLPFDAPLPGESPAPDAGGQSPVGMLRGDRLQ